MENGLVLTFGTELAAEVLMFELIVVTLTSIAYTAKCQLESERGNTLKKHPCVTLSPEEVGGPKLTLVPTWKLPEEHTLRFCSHLPRSGWLQRGPSYRYVPQFPNSPSFLPLPLLCSLDGYEPLLSVNCLF